MGSWKDKKRGHWCYSFQFRNKDYAGRNFKTRREADAAEAERRKQVKDAEKKTRIGTDLLTLANKYMDFAEKRFAQKTADYKHFVIAGFMRKVGKDKLVKEIVPLDIFNYLQTRPSNNNFNVHRKDLSAMFSFGNKVLKLGIANPCADIEEMPHTVKAKDIPSEEDVLKIIMAADPKTDEQDLVLCVIHTLGRIDELLRLTWQDVNFEKRTVTLWTRKRKGGKYEPDTLPMNQDLYDVLQPRWKKRKSDKWVFLNPETEDRYNRRPKLMGGLCKRAGITPLGTTKRRIKGKVKEIPVYYGWHSLRHFMASYLADREKIGTKAISGLLRHKNLRTTEIYIQSIDESQRVAMDRIEGKFRAGGQTENEKEKSDAGD
jgi:integrase